MQKMARWRIFLVVAAAVLGLLYSLPTFLPANLRAQIPGFLPREELNLGLDLQGGSYLLLEVDTGVLRRQQLENVADRMATALRDAEPAIRYTGRGVVADAARVRLVDPADSARALQLVRSATRETSGQASGARPEIQITQGADGAIEGRLSADGLRALSRQAAQQSIEVIRRRIDPNGTSEVSIQRQGDDRVVVQAPGVSDPELLKERIGKTALLTFHMVSENVDQAAIQAGRLPPGTIAAPPYPEIGDGGEIVRRRPFMTGEHLTNASPRVDPQTQGWVMSMDFDSEGLRTFCRLTTDNVGKRFAILLDEQVLTAPVIRGPICGGGGQIEGNFTAASASELSLMLRAGALPAPLTVIEQRTVGAELGQDAITAGTLSIIVSGVGVLIFMWAMYGLFGLLAFVALIVNMGLILMAMVLGNATLSLPGIAGLVLTIGMAVDANVLIYERMREEQAAGRMPAMAIEAGFSRAFVTILDSHITQLGAALILFQFGHGPVRGFAWTLSIGCITSVFTCTMVTHLFIQTWFRSTRPKQLPI